MICIGATLQYLIFFNRSLYFFNIIFPKSALLDCSGVLLYKSVKTTLFSVLWKILCVHVLYPDCSGKFRRENICRLHLQKKAQNVESRTKWLDYISHQDYLNLVWILRVAQKMKSFEPLGAVPRHSRQKKQFSK